MRYLVQFKARLALLVLAILTLWVIATTSSRTLSFKVKHTKSPRQVDLVVFPLNFTNEPVLSLRKLFPLLRSKEYAQARLQLGPSTSASNFKAHYGQGSSHPIQLFNLDQFINMNMEKCGALEKNLTGIRVSDKISLGTSVKKIVRQIIEGIDSGYDTYLQEMAPYFIEQIRLQYHFDVCEKHWFRMAGSSVWLEAYGVHMMVSRLAYSPDGSRNNPKLSFVYTELFDSNWEPVTLSLVVPSNIAQGYRFFEHNGHGYTIVNYPTILPIPFFHDYDYNEMKYLGPEDARVILVKNPAGHEEPLLVFNAWHQKLAYLDDDEDEYLVKKMQEYRSMWVGWPWQYQRGKTNVDGFADSRFDTLMYNRVKELMIKNIPRQVKQKNWTPLISEMLRSKLGYDNELLFIYRWANLQILKCDLVGEGRCGFVYKLNKRLVTSSKVGPLRGGTQLININQLIASSSSKEITDKLIPPGREIWIGFARAHLVKCGCGNDLYRPNLVVITKDTVTVDGTSTDHYKVSHISGFMSLNVEIISWNPNRPYELCSGTNALIPNGISKWDLKVEMDQNGKVHFYDEVHLAISVSDSTIDGISMKGLLNSLITSQNTLVLTTDELNDKAKQDLQIPMSEDNLEGLGYNNDNIICAMDASSRFCSEYGDEKIRIENEKGGNYKDNEVDTYEEKMEDYKAALFDLGYDY